MKPRMIFGLLVIIFESLLDICYHFNFRNRNYYTFIYFILQDMLPEYIPMQVAESILFAGKAIRVLRNPSPTFKFHDAPSHQQIPRGSQKIQGFNGRFSFQRDSSVCTTLIAEELLPQSEADKIESMLQDLKVFIIS